MNKSIMAMVAVGAAASTLYMVAVEVRRRLEGRRLGTQIEQWEGEGGNVPAVTTLTPGAGEIDKDVADGR